MPIFFASFAHWLYIWGSGGGSVWPFRLLHCHIQTWETLHVWIKWRYWFSEIWAVQSLASWVVWWWVNMITSYNLEPCNATSSLIMGHNCLVLPWCRGWDFYTASHKSLIFHFIAADLIALISNQRCGHQFPLTLLSAFIAWAAFPFLLMFLCLSICWILIDNWGSTVRFWIFRIAKMRIVWHDCLFNLIMLWIAT